LGGKEVDDLSGWRVWIHGEDQTLIWKPSQSLIYNPKW